MSFDETLKKATSKKAAKKLKRRLKRTNRAMSRFDKILSGGGKKGGGGGSGGGGESVAEPKPTRRGSRGGGGGEAAPIPKWKQQQLNAQKFGGGSGGGSGGGDSAPKKLGTRGVAQQLIENQLTNPLNPELDTKFEDERLALSGKLEDTRGKLFELDDETKAGFQEQLDAEQALAERQFGTQRDTLLTRLFGKGRTEGQLAGTMGGQLIGDQQLVLQQMSAADQGRRLQSRFALGDQNIQNLGMQGGLMEGSRAAALQEMGIQQSERQGNLAAAVGLDTTYEGADAQRDSSRMAAAASRYGSDRALEGSKYSSDASVRAAGIGASAQVKAAGIHAAASRANAMASLSASKYGTNAGLLSNMMGLEQQGSHFSQDLAFRNTSLETNAQLQREQMAQQQRQFEDSQPSMFDKLLGAAAGGASSFFSGGFSNLGGG